MRAGTLLKEASQQFKFLTSDEVLLCFPPELTNDVSNGKSHFNRALFRHCTRWNLYQLTATEPFELSLAATWLAT